jgi:hypothetical protein
MIKAIIIIVALLTCITVLIVIGELFATKYPKDKFSKWWRKKNCSKL